MSLINNNTKWALFLSTSQNNPEDRHILDLVFGVMCLENSGIAAQDIHIYVDGKDRTNISNLFSLASTTKYAIKHSSDFFVELQNNSYENLVMFVTGHGSESGIDAITAISPHTLVQSLKSSPNLDQAIIYLGQCYAGIFNYVKAGRTVNEGQAPSANIVLIGATELQESMSSATSEQFPTTGNQIPWIANVFLLHIFKWISSPFDVDGDNLHTIIDSYKYAGVMTNRSHKSIKANTFMKLMDDYEELKKAKDAVDNPTGDTQIDMQNQLRLSAINKQYYQSSYISNIHQECWILNSIPAQSIEL